MVASPPQVAEHRVGPAHEVFEHRSPGVGAQVEADAALAPIERFEEQAVFALGEGRHVAPDVAAGARILDLDDIGAQIGELQTAEGGRRRTVRRR